MHQRRPTPEDATPVLTFRVPREVADELGRFVATWQGVFMAAREYEDAHPDSGAWALVLGSYGNPDSSGARTVPLSESSFLLGALLHGMKEYAGHIKREAEREHPLGYSREMMERESLTLHLTTPLRLWALTHPHVDLWGLAQRAYTRTAELAEKRRRTKSGGRPATLYGAKKTARAQARRAIPPPASEPEA